MGAKCYKDLVLPHYTVEKQTMSQCFWQEPSWTRVHITSVRV